MRDFSQLDSILGRIPCFIRYWCHCQNFITDVFDPFETFLKIRVSTLLRGYSFIILRMASGIEFYWRAAPIAGGSGDRIALSESCRLGYARAKP